ncbi:MAG: hypothetical protein R2854_18340 [Caldilineaceae bacterium]
MPADAGVGMASGTADLQRYPGGALFQSIFGALLAAGYAASMAAQLGDAPDAAQVSSSVANIAGHVLAGAQNVATQYPQYADQTAAAAKTAFLAGDDKAYLRASSPW